MILWLDLESYSECDLKTHGTHRYAEHSSTEIIVAQWALDDGEPVVLDCAALTGVYRQNPMRPLFDLLEDPTVTVIAHNSHFDRTILRHVWGIDVPVERWEDTMIKAMAHGLPGSLDKIGQIVGLDADKAKDKRGRELIQLFCKPRPKGHELRRATRETHPKEWSEFLEYSRQDIVAMRAIHERLPSWNYRAGHPELALWHLDQQINDRGVAVDVELAQAAIAAVGREQKRLKAEVVEATDGLVASASKRDQLLAFILAEYGVDLPDMKADTLRRRLEDPELPEGVKLLISIRLEATKTSTAKYKALVNAASADGRLRNTLQFAGAQRTARWAGRIFQPQNMPRPQPGFDGEAQDLVVEALKGGFADIVYDDVMQQTANAIRGCIVAKPRHKLCVADLSNIEGRGLVYLAGEDWKLRAFREFDKGVGADLYLLAYARAFNVDTATVSKSQRQIGKVQELACLAGDTPVVTDRGIKPLAKVTTEDKVWDGREWVGHQGLVFRGLKATINLCGVEVTPDHLIATGPTWTQAQELASCASTLSLALATASENSPSWPSSATATAPVTGTWQGSSVRAGQSPTWSTSTTFARAPAPVVTRAQRKQQATGARSSTDMRTSSLTRAIASVYSTGYRPASPGATARTTRVTTATAAAASKCTPPGEGTAEVFSRTSSLWRAGTSPCLNWTESTSTEDTSPATCASSRNERTKETAARSANCRTESRSLSPVYDLLDAGPRHRFTVMTSMGPLIVHNCGYEGGPAAYLTMAAVYGMDLQALSKTVFETAPADVLSAATERHDWMEKKNRTRGLPKDIFIACQSLVSMWRDAHPNTTALWKAAGESVRAAIQNPGQSFSIGEHLKARRDGAWLRIRLPSGRYLCYINPSVDEGGQISYFGVSQYTRQWGRIKTYGGKLIENATQAFARDVLAANMPLTEACGYEIVLSVHDELLAETPDNDDFSSDALSKMMSHCPAWAKGLPLAAAGFETYRYRKE